MILRPEAEADLGTAWTWYERQRGGLGAAFLLCVEEVLDRIDRAPALYPVVYQEVRRAFTRRFPYAVYYHVMDKDVVVLGILHTRQVRTRGSHGPKGGGKAGQPRVRRPVTLGRGQRVSGSLSQRAPPNTKLGICVYRAKHEAKSLH